MIDFKGTEIHPDALEAAKLWASLVGWLVSGWQLQRSIHAALYRRRASGRSPIVVTYRGPS
jgi:hypothetical protein